MKILTISINTALFEKIELIRPKNINRSEFVENLIDLGLDLVSNKDKNNIENSAEK